MIFCSKKELCASDVCKKRIKAELRWVHTGRLAERKTPLKILRINGKTYIITKLTEIEWMELMKQSSDKVYINEKRRSVYDSYETKIVEDQFNANIIGAMVAYPRSIFKSPLPQTDQHELISQCLDYQLRSMR